MATNLYLEISDGTTTVTIADGAGGQTNWRLAYGQWAPKVARIRLSELGGRGPYEDVVEELTLNIYGATAAAAYANLKTLVQLLDQVQRFSLGEPVPAVVVKYSPGGGTVSSTGSPLQATIIGVSPGQDFTNLSPDFNATELMFVIREVKVRFTRIGQWLRSSESASSSLTNIGAKMTVTLPSSPVAAGPIDLKIANLGATLQNSDPILPSHLLTVANAATHIFLSTTKPAGAHADFTTVADSANLATGGDVARFTPSAANTYRYYGDLYPGAWFKRLQFLITVRSSTTARTWTFRPYVSQGTSGAIVRGPETIWVPANTSPTPLVLGEVVSEDFEYANTALEIKVDSTAGAPTLDIDIVAILNTGNGESAIFAMTENFIPGSMSGPMDYVIEHRLLAASSPLVGVRTGGTSQGVRLGYKSDPIFFISGNTVAAVLLAPKSNYWNIPNLGATAIGQVALTATRRFAHLTPE